MKTSCKSSIAILVGFAVLVADQTTKHLAISQGWQHWLDTGGSDRVFGPVHTWSDITGVTLAFIGAVAMAWFGRRSTLTLAVLAGTIAALASNQLDWLGISQAWTRVGAVHGVVDWIQIGGMACNIADLALLVGIATIGVLAARLAILCRHEHRLDVQRVITPTTTILPDK